MCLRYSWAYTCSASRGVARWAHTFFPTSPSCTHTRTHTDRQTDMHTHAHTSVRTHAPRQREKTQVCKDSQQHKHTFAPNTTHTHSHALAHPSPQSPQTHIHYRVHMHTPLPSSPGPHYARTPCSEAPLPPLLKEPHGSPNNRRRSNETCCQISE